jgi:hypothetical protein
MEHVVNSHDAMTLGMKIAQRHKAHVTQLMNEFSCSPSSALDACLLSLAAEIMVAVQDHRLITEPPSPDEMARNPTG